MSETAPPACEVPSHLSGASLGRASKLDSGSGVGRHKYGSSHVCFSKAHREAGGFPHVPHGLMRFRPDPLQTLLCPQGAGLGRRAGSALARAGEFSTRKEM